MPTVFIAGTDTEVGKTWVSVKLLEMCKRQKVTALGYKPIAAGCEWAQGQWQNEDALQLRAASARQLPYAEINTYALEEPIAPHIAARRAGVQIAPERIQRQSVKLAQQTDWLLIEGAGGLRVPLDDDLDYLQLVAACGWPVLLVVGMRLGCINHALLSAQALDAAGLRWAWIANALPPQQPFLAENLITLEERLNAPQLCLRSENCLQDLAALMA